MEPVLQQEVVVAVDAPLGMGEEEPSLHHSVSVCKAGTVTSSGGTPPPPDGAHPERVLDRQDGAVDEELLHSLRGREAVTEALEWCSG